MRLVEAIIAANHAAIEGRRAEMHLAQFADSLPLAALTCIDARLNKLFPEALGIDEERFIWLRNAGNVITSPTSSTVRSLSIAVLLKGAKEIAVIGHTDCRMSKLGMADLLEKLKAAGIDRSALTMPNLHEFFGLFSAEKPNVIKAVGYIRSSPIIPVKVPVHGLIIETNTGRLDWVVNGYESVGLPQTGVTLKEVVEAKLSPNLPGYVAGPIKSFAENIEPLITKKWEQAAEKLAGPPPIIKKPAVKKGDKGPAR